LQLKIIDGYTGIISPVLTIDNSGNLYGCFYNGSYNEIDYIEKPCGGDWQNFGYYIGTGYSLVAGLDITTDITGKVHLIVSDSIDDNNIKILYYTNTNGEWTTQQLDNIDPLTQIECYVKKIAVDMNGFVHILGKRPYPYNTLIYITNQNAWDYREITNTPGYIAFCDLTVDRNNYPHASFSTDGDCALNYLTYHTDYNNLEWQKIDSDIDMGNGYYNSIAVDYNGNVHISCSSGGYSALKYITNISGSWHTYIIDDIIITSSGIALINETYPVIAYSGNNSLKIARITW